MPTNYEALSKSPLTKSDQYGDTRNTTWGSENGAAPAFNNAYARTLLERDYVSSRCIYLHDMLSAISSCVCRRRLCLLRKVQPSVLHKCQSRNCWF